MTAFGVRLRADFIPWDRLPMMGLGPALRLWVERGISPGGFMESMLCNDLRWSVLNANSESRRLMLAWVLFLHESMPPECWGSAEIVAAWAEHRGLAGIERRPAESYAENLHWFEPSSSARIAAARLRLMKQGEDTL